ncbi:MAG: alanine racemase [Clostridiales bacterium]|nr:alanine racemase [Clostridiales bacterium]
MFFRTEAAVDLNAVEYNYNQIRKKLPENVMLLGVIKADAYGHGAVKFAEFLKDKCDFFGVACIEEAIELINAGIKTPILILGRVFPEDFNAAVQNNIRVPIFTYSDAKKLSEEAVKQNKTALFHFCVDTGMSRIGFQTDEKSADICKKITALPNIEAEGIFSHFATADEKDLTKTYLQKEKFINFISLLESRNINVPIKHIDNSAGIMNFGSHFDMCRMGIITYGLYPSSEIEKALLDIKPVMSWRTKISYIKTLDAGREISYGGTYKTTETRKIATIPVGYADGYPRCLSNKGKVIINGKFAPIVGRICMDQFMVDITEIENAEEGTEVTLIGKNGGLTISMEEMADAAHSFNYELVCRISRRVTRTYYKNGKLVDYKNYIY